MFRKFFTMMLVITSLSMLTACSGESAQNKSKPGLYNAVERDQIGSSYGGSWLSFRCAKGLQTIDLQVPSTINTLGMDITVSDETYGDLGEYQRWIEVATVLPANIELPVVIIHTDDFGNDSEDDQALEPNLSSGGKLGMRLVTDQYAENRITGLTFCVKVS